jgi:hypothetical protein
MSKQDQTYRKKDVTGALGFVRSLFADLWEAMPEADRPRTDREAASTFFQVDRSNANMAEFLEQLQAHNVAELDRLSKEKRKPGKRIGTLNVLTGEVRGRFPDFITMEAVAYDQLLALVRWVDAAPVCVELPDRAWESIHDATTELVDVDDTRWPEVYVDSVQIETVETMERNITPGTLVALLMCEDESDDQEHHCVLVRGGDRG